MVIDNSFYMRLALDEAWKYQGLTYPNPAVGCSVVGEYGEVLAVEAHHKAGEAHAEVNALKAAFYKLTNNTEILQQQTSKDIHTFLINHHNNIFKSCTVYTTLEPCSKVGKTPACASLLATLNIKKVYIGSHDSTQNSFDFHAKFGILQNECNTLLEPFLLWQKENFIFFKWAQRLNGTVDNGIITSQNSRELVHKIRNVCDLMVIGGDTVREDRPTLDARLCNGKAPDILIYSRQTKFDKTIPLFNVQNRNVVISNSLDILKEYKNIMIEGGSKMYNLTKDIVDMNLTFIAPKFGGNNSFNNNDDEFEILNINQESQDIIMWMKKDQ